MTRPALQKKFQETSFGNIAFLETGSADKPPVLFVHGIPTSGYLWRDVIRLLQNDFHCLAPDLMGLGDTEVDLRTASFDMEAQAEMLVELMTNLGHDSFGLVCHDQGGAAAQLIAARQPERVRCFILTDCVCYDNWPVPIITGLQWLSRLGPIAHALGRSGLAEWVEIHTPLSSFRRGVLERGKMTAASIREYLRPLRGGFQSRERFRRFVLAGAPRYTQQAVAGLQTFAKPTLVIWAADDRYISPSWGKRLFEEIPGAVRFELVPFCGHFWQEERPSEFAGLIGEFLSEHLTAADVEREANVGRLPVVKAPDCARSG